MALILVVDDDRDIRESMCRNLKLHGYEATTAKGGGEVLSRMREGLRPDLILSDTDMFPDVGGVELVTLLKQQYPDTRIVLMTGGDHHKIATAAGVQCYAKPFNPADAVAHELSLQSILPSSG